MGGGERGRVKHLKEREKATCSCQMVDVPWRCLYSGGCRKFFIRCIDFFFFFLQQVGFSPWFGFLPSTHRNLCSALNLCKLLLTWADRGCCPSGSILFEIRKKSWSFEACCGAGNLWELWIGNFEVDLSKYDVLIFAIFNIEFRKGWVLCTEDGEYHCPLVDEGMLESCPRKYLAIDCWSSFPGVWKWDADLFLTLAWPVNPLWWLSQRANLSQYIWF